MLILTPKAKKILEKDPNLILKWLRESKKVVSFFGTEGEKLNTDQGFWNRLFGNYFFKLLKIEWIEGSIPPLWFEFDVLKEAIISEIKIEFYKPFHWGSHSKKFRPPLLVYPYNKVLISLG